MARMRFLSRLWAAIAILAVWQGGCAAAYGDRNGTDHSGVKHPDMGASAGRHDAGGGACH